MIGLAYVRWTYIRVLSADAGISGHLVGHRVAGILGDSWYFVHICYMLLPILLLSIGGPLNKERDLYVIADATVRRRRATQ